jgi:hypothetical protein
MTDILRTKGVIVEAVIAGLRPNLERVRSRIPARLQRYLEEPILASAWYPFDEYMALLDILASTVDPKVVPGDPYLFFGRTAAQRDIGGSQERVPRKQRAPSAGVYRSTVLAGQGVAGQIRRVLAVRRQYFSASTYEVKRTGERTLRIRLLDFPVVSSNSCSGVTGFLDEAFTMLKLGRVSKTTCKAIGGTECTWELRLDPDVDVSELIAFE